MSNRAWKASGVLQIALLASLAPSCAKEEMSARNRGGNISSLSANGELQTEAGMGFYGLGLAESITVFSYHVICSGGFVGPATTAPTFALFGAQTGCQLILDSFKRDGATFSPKAGTKGFVDGASVGTSVLFANPAGKELKITVLAQLPSPLVGGAANVSYGFSEIVGGSTVTFTNALSTTSGGFSLGGPAAPKLVLRSVDTVAVSPVQIGIRVRFECSENIAGAAAASYTCAGDVMNDLRFAYKKSDGVAISEAILDTLFASSTLVSAQNPAAQFYPAGNQSDLPKGGLQIVINIPNSNLSSPADFDGNGVLFALSPQNSRSYSYAMARSVSGVGTSDFNTSTGNHITLVGNTAYIADAYSVLIADVSNPSAMTLKSKYTDGVSYTYSVAVDSKNVVYVANGSSTLLTFDASKPAAPKKLGSYTKATTSVDNVLVSNGVAYLTSYYNNPGLMYAELMAVDVSNPAAPTLLKSIQFPDIGTHPGVTLIGNRLISDYGYSGLATFDVTTPASFFKSGGNVDLPGTGYSNVMVQDDVLPNNRLVVTNRIEAQNIVVLDGSASPPRVLGSISTGTSYTSDVAARNGMIFAIVGGALNIYDATNPSSIVKKDTIVTSTESVSVALTCDRILIAGVNAPMLSIASPYVSNTCK